MKRLLRMCAPWVGSRGARGTAFTARIHHVMHMRVRCKQLATRAKHGSPLLTSTRACKLFSSFAKLHGNYRVVRCLAYPAPCLYLLRAADTVPRTRSLLLQVFIHDANVVARRLPPCHSVRGSTQRGRQHTQHMATCMRTLMCALGMRTSKHASHAVHHT